MRRFIDMIGMTAAGWLGWVVAAPISTFAAYIASVIAAGLGMWATRRFLTRHLP